MDCPKCEGLMLYEGFYGATSNAVWYYPGWRCVYCGDIVDPIISLNRRLKKEAVPSQPGMRRATFMEKFRETVMVPRVARDDHAEADDER